MSLIIATGTNLGDKFDHLLNAKIELSKHFNFIAASQVFRSEAVDYTDQPDFYNQVLEFEIPTISPIECIDLLLDIEQKFGRVRNIDKGPRTIDIDIIFWGLETLNYEHKLHVPHPSWYQRSFVVKPLMQLPYFKILEKNFNIPTTFAVNAFPVDNF